MSQRREKKQLSILDDVSSLTDHELREILKEYNQTPGPITDSTRNLYRKKLASLIAESGDKDLSTSSGQSAKVREETVSLPANTVGDDDDDTSDEDYNVQDEESEYDEEEEEEYDEDDDELIDELDDDIKLSSTTNESENRIRSLYVGPDVSPNRISRGILSLIVAFFVAIFSYYLYSIAPEQRLKNFKVPLLATIILSLICYVVYKTYRFFTLRSSQEMQRVCGLVKEALELLQSPDNPKGMMPILHIRDTLLTPAERKTPYMINLWSQTVKFIEEHESRVKVELVNIDSEDFRAWKWIGSRKV